ncbi:MAG: MarR family transcriptional regulator [Pseudomonadota bacterium]
MSTESKARLRLWVRLLRTSRAVENEIRERLRTEFDVTLPRFDVLAALFRQPDGMLMSELSRFLMVSNGNVTGIIDRLVADGLVERAKRNGDRRTSMVRLTPKGRTDFETMARTHESWINDLLGGLPPDEVEAVSSVLHSFAEYREIHS